MFCNIGKVVHLKDVQTNKVNVINILRKIEGLIVGEVCNLYATPNKIIAGLMKCSMLLLAHCSFFQWAKSIEAKSKFFYIFWSINMAQTLVKK